jgi:KUP system potassium uptake protein
MVLLATAATLIASQAVISGAFSLSRQAMQLGFLPRLPIRHTSQQTEGQIYVPAVNWTLFAAVVAVVVGFGSSARLSSAYGLAVSGTFLITTVLFLVVARLRWHWHKWKLGAVAALFVPMEATFLAANLGKIAHGGWLPLTIGGGVYTLMTTWHRGSEIVRANRMRCASSSPSCTPCSRRSRGSSARRSSSTRPGTPRRSRCVRTSNTTTCCTSASWS